MAHRILSERLASRSEEFDEYFRFYSADTRFIKCWKDLQSHKQAFPNRFGWEERKVLGIGPGLTAHLGESSPSGPLAGNGQVMAPVLDLTLIHLSNKQPGKILTESVTRTALYVRWTTQVSTEQQITCS